MTVSSEIIEVLDYLGEKFGIAIDWTSNNVLPYLQTLADKFIKWEISTSIVWIVIAAFVIVAMIVLINLKGFREINEETYGMLWIPIIALIISKNILPTIPNIPAVFVFEYLSIIIIKPPKFNFFIISLY